jgi:TetR/AcrR family transcriptional regulator
VQFGERLEAQFRQILRESALTPGAAAARATIPAAANLICAVLPGRIAHYVRTGYRRQPDEAWEDQWVMLSRGVFPDGSPDSSTER